MRFAAEQVANRLAGRQFFRHAHHAANRLIGRIQRAKHRNEISTLNSEIEKYRKQYEEDTEKLKELTSNPEALEKIAREKYLMKKPNEDVYVFEQ